MANDSIMDVAGTLNNAKRANLVMRLNDDEPGLVHVVKTRWLHSDGTDSKGTVFSVPMSLWHDLHRAGQRGRHGSDCVFVFVGDHFLERGDKALPAIALAER